MTVSFACTDAQPGSGIEQDVGGGTTVTQETGGQQVTPTGCTDTAGNQAAASAVTVKLDKTAPTFGATISPAPNAAGWSDHLPVTISFPCTDTGAVQSGSTGSPASASVAIETGQQTFTRDASACTDKAGNSAAEGVVATVKVDVTLPDTSITSAPSGTTSSTSATVDLSGTDNLSGVAGFECQFDGAPYAPCPSTTTYDGLADGIHTLLVRATDKAGNIDNTPAQAFWTVDSGAPNTQITDRPAVVTNQTTATFTYTGSDSGSPIGGYECSLDGAAFSACPGNPATYSGLAQGEHSLAVRAYDGAGNRDDSPATWDWTVDLTAPTTQLTDGPPNRTPERSATFAFSATDSGGGDVDGTECSLDGGAFQPCTSPATYPGLDLGEHTFAVRAVDTVGNVGDVVTRTWSVLEFFVEDDAATTDEETPVTIAAGDNDVAPDGAHVTLHPEASAAGGTVEVQDGALRYTPPGDFSGTDTFSYTASNGGATTTPATVTVVVRPVNDAPRFTPGGAVTATEDSGAHQAAWAGAVDPGPKETGQAVHFVLDQLSDPALFAVPPSLGPAGVLRFTPAADASGTATVRVRLVDDGGTSSGGTDTSAPVTLTITVTPVDDAPALEVLDFLRVSGDRAWLKVRVTDVDTAAPAFGARASGELQTKVAARGDVRKIRIDGLDQGAHGRLVLRASDEMTSAKLVVRVRVGTDGVDRMRGTPGADLLVGRGGDDVIRGRAGDDLLAGGGGDDRLVGGAGDDVIRGGPGHNQVVDRLARVSRSRGTVSPESGKPPRALGTGPAGASEA